VISLSERIIVLRGGRVAGELPRKDATQDSVLRLMAGLGEAADPTVGSTR
jgi:ABC-type sugar transport system ATPase subunit